MEITPATAGLLSALSLEDDWCVYDSDCMFGVSVMLDWSQQDWADASMMALHDGQESYLSALRRPLSITEYLDLKPSTFLSAFSLGRTSGNICLPVIGLVDAG